MGVKVINSYYGGVGLLRGRCPECKKMAIVIDGKFQCCGEKAEEPETISKKRMIQGQEKRFRLSTQEKEEILERQNYKCIYCDTELEGKWYMTNTMKNPRKVTPHFDHFIPWVYSRSCTSKEFVVSCDYCNSLKSSKHFANTEEAKKYLIKRRLEKGIEVI